MPGELAGNAERSAVADAATGAAAAVAEGDSPRELDWQAWLPVRRRVLAAAIEPPLPPAADNTLLLYLSLFLLVFAFFIVLVSDSSLDGTRSAAVTGSLARTFAPAAVDVHGPDRGNREDGDRIGRPDVEDRLSALFASRLPAATVTAIGGGQRLVVSMPQDSLFRRGTAAIRPAQVRLIDQVIAAVSDGKPGARCRLEIRIAAAADGSDRYVLGSDNGAMDRAAALARLALRRGFPSEALAVGVESDQRTRVVFVFHFDRSEQPAPAAETTAAGDASEGAET
jgi:hypothetical protein